MRILLFGKNGQVGWELQHSLAGLGDLTAIDMEGEGEYCGDFTDLDGLRRTIRSMKPDLIVNAAAYTAVDKAESEPELAELINVRAPGILAEEIQRLNGWLVHYSTDYVFDGSGAVPWRESDRTAPLSVYGRTKLGGEAAIRGAGCKNLIFRTSWVCGAHGNNFAKTMLRLARGQETIRVIDDQFGVPATSSFLAEMTAHAIGCALKDEGLTGTYNLVPDGETTWYGFAEFVFEQARVLGEQLMLKTVVPVPTESYPTPAQRPKNSRLDTLKFQTSFSKSMPNWRDGVSTVIAEILREKK